MVQSYNTVRKPLKLHLTELGFSVSSTGYSTVPSTARQADYLSRLMLLLMDVRLQGVPLETVFWYDLKQDNDSVGEYESNFGLISNDTSQVRPAYTIYSRISRDFGDPAQLSAIKQNTSWNNWPGVIKHYTWKRKDGALIVPFWRMNQLQPVDRDFASELTLDLPADFTLGSVELHDLNEDQPRLIAVQTQGRRLRVPLRVTARASWITISPK